MSIMIIGLTQSLLMRQYMFSINLDIHITTRAFLMMEQLMEHLTLSTTDLLARAVFRSRRSTFFGLQKVGNEDGVPSRGILVRSPRTFTLTLIWSAQDNDAVAPPKDDASSFSDIFSICLTRPS